jgi:hypothetical protein
MKNYLILYLVMLLACAVFAIETNGELLGFLLSLEYHFIYRIAWNGIFIIQPNIYYFHGLYPDFDLYIYFFLYCAMIISDQPVNWFSVMSLGSLCYNSKLNIVRGFCYIWFWIYRRSHTTHLTKSCVHHISCAFLSFAVLFCISSVFLVRRLWFGEETQNYILGVHI